jgi:anti-anti-sigma regulatory factor
MLLKAYETLTREGRDRIILHFDRSFSVNGAGIAILIQLLTESKKRNQSVAVCGLPENLRKVFSMVGITRFARIFDSEGDAMESIRQAGSGN